MRARKFVIIGVFLIVFAGVVALGFHGATYRAALYTLKEPVAGRTQGAPAPTDVPVVMFFDYECDYCEKAQEALDRMIASEKDLYVVYQPLPVTSERGIWAARLALAAADDRRFFTLHRKLMEKNALESDVHLRLAVTEAGFDYDDLSKKAANPEIIEKLAKIRYSTMQLTDELITPSFLIGDVYYPVTCDLQELDNELHKIVSVIKGEIREKN